ncbi:MAG: hypothetical protein FWE22_05860 [Firmicutes bacterium]|nr:hypothetical protein [Bacillota bacterium]
MEKEKIPLSKTQNEIMAEFYEKPPTKVVFRKRIREKLWKFATKREDIPEEYDLKEICPALFCEIEKSIASGRNIQSAIFSECVYAQTLANMFLLNNCIIFQENPNFLPQPILSLLKSYSLVARYVYSNEDNSRMLIQAGGPGGVDSALITVIDLNIYKIEFKEPWSKGTEADLPNYCEEGKLISSLEFEDKHPYLMDMLSEHIGTSIFDIRGHNISKFSPDSVITAVSKNYTSKMFADVCCTEDKKGLLTMLPCNQIPQWALLMGEIRSTGKNHYEVWTPNALKNVIEEKGGILENGIVQIEKSKLLFRRQRGGNRAISGHKINESFFVYLQDCKEVGDKIFNINKVRQVKPTIAGKMDFKELDYFEVKEYYQS